MTTHEDVLAAVRLLLHAIVDRGSGASVDGMMAVPVIEILALADVMRDHEATEGTQH